MRNDLIASESVLRAAARALLLGVLALSLSGCGMFGIGKPKPKTDADLEADSVSHRIFYEDWIHPTSRMPN